MNIIEDESFENKLLKLSKQGNWEEILELGKTVSLEERSRFSWVFPTKEALRFIDTQMKKENIERILSVGCGSGLLEFLIHKSTGLIINGLELDYSWWKSKYSPETFIELNFTSEKISKEFLLKKSGSIINNNFALLFCYFNNGDAFRDYIKKFIGKIIIIVGPGEGNYNHTDPKPFQPNMDTSEFEWNIVSSMEIGNTKDFIVIWKKNI